MTNYYKDTIVAGGTDNYSSTTSYVLFPNHKLDINPDPLWRQESPNWKRQN